jgi:hypothetical protein
MQSSHAFFKHLGAAQTCRPRRNGACHDHAIDRALATQWALAAVVRVNEVVLCRWLEPIRLHPPHSARRGLRLKGLHRTRTQPAPTHDDDGVPAAQRHRTRKQTQPETTATRHDGGSLANPQV